MKYETVLRRLMDAAYAGFNSKSQNISLCVNGAIDAIIAESGDVTKKQIISNPFIMRAEGPIMTATIFCRSAKGSTYGDIVAAGLIRLRSNHRVLAYKSDQLGWPDIDQYQLKYVESAGFAGHKPTPAFTIGDLSQTDQALRYLMSCWALTGCRPEYASDKPAPLTDDYLVKMAKLRYPVALAVGTSVWPTDNTLEQALRPRLMAGGIRSPGIVKLGNFSSWGGVI